jgi:hypothetical protein
MINIETHPVSIVSPDKAAVGVNGKTEAHGASYRTPRAPPTPAVAGR